MGVLLHLHDHRRAPVATSDLGAPAFYFDLSSPLTYLAAERVERLLGEAQWVPVDGAAFRVARDRHSGRLLPDRRWPAELSARVEERARVLRLPLVWPDRFPQPAPRASRAAAFACELGLGARFVPAASRLAFCGGFDLEDPETLAEAAAAATVPLDGCLQAAGESFRDAELRAVAQALAALGVGELPAFHAGGRWYEGEHGLFSAAVRRRHVSYLG
jgi:2-hydroxychromene-2-carboxylate isomerase